jgi:Radical SAM proteins, N-terminal
MSLTTADAPASVFPRLEPLLARVHKPIQYVGGELNSVAKNWDAVDVRWCLSYPDAYEVGLPNQGIAILYEILNEQDWILAERTYAVWGDLEALMREHAVPQFTLDSHRPVAAFEVLGFSFATELGYTNMLNTLDLAGIPLHAADRRDHDPLVLAGGHAAFNPEPIADFLDAAVLGDGEEIALTISEVIREWKAAGCPDGRDGLLLSLATGGGVYVPKFYDVDYLPDGRISRVAANRGGVPDRVVKHTLMDLDAWPYPKKPLVALLSRDLPRLYSWLPVLPGGDDHQAGSRAQHRNHWRDGAWRDPGDWAGGGRAAQSVQCRPLRDRRHHPRAC